MSNTKIKQRKCPFGKVELCDSYGNCGDCTWHKVIEKYEKKIAKLQQEYGYIANQLTIEKEQYKWSNNAYHNLCSHLSSHGIEIVDDYGTFNILDNNTISQGVARDIVNYITETINNIICDKRTLADQNKIVADYFYDCKNEILKKYGVEVK